ncbi:uncharacterized protein LOC135136857 isoform X2 [Zophobas morio]|uniref:uncharacterized protein LOC135136857 isoform X2 n=1 Tax=Zophobas morio TaxID=2755281 RepID=UPI003083C215
MMNYYFKSFFKITDAADNDVNLLLLGETRVGKSTLVNAISNYFNYASFKEAQKRDIDILIPMYLNVAESSRVFGTADENEVHDQGKSATQYVKVYVFPIKMDNKTFNLRLIDTPGVGDPRGMEQDNINLDNVLAYLATLKKLHGICFVLKSNQTRFTKFAEYCLKQILTRLDKSASQNIIFITTYSKTAGYTAGETKSHCLAPLVKDIKSRPPYANIPLSDDNVFCLDNEAFEALLASQDGKRYTKREVKGFETSWQVSSNEIQRLLRYVIGDASSPGLKPHDVENTISINEVRFHIEQLATPIAEVSELIQDNIRVLDAHKKKMQQNDQTLEELKQQMHIPCVNIEVKELTQPVTVCTDPKCADIVKVNNVTQWHYKKRCHNPCYLTGVPKEMFGDPKLMCCAAMAGRPNCQQCECPWQVHMHIYKETTKVSVRTEDQNVLGVIKNKQDARFHMHKLIEDLNTRRRELEKEGETISSIVAKFSWFLQEHALTPFNDAYGEYIEQLIKNEKYLGRLADREVIEKLENLLSQHYNLQATFHESAKNAQGQPPGDLSLKGIQKSIAELYKLKHMGKTIQELIQKSIACRNKERQKNFGCVTLREVVDLDKTAAERERCELTESDDDEQPRQTKASEEEYEVDVDWGKESYVPYEPVSAVTYTYNGSNREDDRSIFSNYHHSTSRQSSKPRTFIDDDGFNSRQHSRRTSPDRRYVQPRDTYTQRDNFKHRTQYSRDSDGYEPVKSHRNEAKAKYDRRNYAHQRHVEKEERSSTRRRNHFPGNNSSEEYYNTSPSKHNKVEYSPTRQPHRSDDFRNSSRREYTERSRHSRHDFENHDSDSAHSARPSEEEMFENQCYPDGPGNSDDIKQQSNHSKLHRTLLVSDDESDSAKPTSRRGKIEGKEKIKRNDDKEHHLTIRNPTSRTQDDQQKLTPAASNMQKELASITDNVNNQENLMQNVSETMKKQQENVKQFMEKIGLLLESNKMENIDTLKKQLKSFLSDSEDGRNKHHQTEHSEHNESETISKDLESATQKESPELDYKVTYTYRTNNSEDDKSSKPRTDDARPEYPSPERTYNDPREPRHSGARYHHEEDNRLAEASGSRNHLTRSNFSPRSTSPERYHYPTERKSHRRDHRTHYSPRRHRCRSESYDSSDRDFRRSSRRHATRYTGESESYDSDDNPSRNRTKFKSYKAYDSSNDRHKKSRHVKNKSSRRRRSSDEDIDTKREKKSHRRHHKGKRSCRCHRSSSESYDSDDDESRRSFSSGSASSAKSFDSRSSVKRSKDKTGRSRGSEQHRSTRTEKKSRQEVKESSKRHGHRSRSDISDSDDRDSRKWSQRSGNKHSRRKDKSDCDSDGGHTTGNGLKKSKNQRQSNKKHDSVGDRPVKSSKSAHSVPKDKKKTGDSNDTRPAKSSKSGNTKDEKSATLGKSDLVDPHSSQSSTREPNSNERESEKQPNKNKENCDSLDKQSVKSSNKDTVQVSKPKNKIRSKSE